MAHGPHSVPAPRPVAAVFRPGLAPTLRLRMAVLTVKGTRLERATRRSVQVRIPFITNLLTNVNLLNKHIHAFTHDNCLPKWTVDGHLSVRAPQLVAGGLRLELAPALHLSMAETVAKAAPSERATRRVV